MLAIEGLQEFSDRAMSHSLEAIKRIITNREISGATELGHNHPLFEGFVRNTLHMSAHFEGDKMIIFSEGAGFVEVFPTDSFLGMIYKLSEKGFIDSAMVGDKREQGDLFKPGTRVKDQSEMDFVLSWAKTHLKKDEGYSIIFDGLEIGFKYKSGSVIKIYKPSMDMIEDQMRALTIWVDRAMNVMDEELVDVLTPDARVKTRAEMEIVVSWAKKHLGRETHYIIYQITPNIVFKKEAGLEINIKRPSKNMIKAKMKALDIWVDKATTDQDDAAMVMVTPEMLNRIDPKTIDLLNAAAFAQYGGEPGLKGALSEDNQRRLVERFVNSFENADTDKYERFMPITRILYVFFMSEFFPKDMPADVMESLESALIEAEDHLALIVGASPEHRKVLLYVKDLKTQLLEKGHLDSAMTGQDLVANVKGATRGGIDFNPEAFEMDVVKSDGGVEFPVPVAPVDAAMFNGFVPIIINVETVTSIPMFLGVADEEPVNPEGDTADSGVVLQELFYYDPNGLFS